MRQNYKLQNENPLKQWTNEITGVINTRLNAAEKDGQHTNKIDPNLRTYFVKRDGIANDFGEGNPGGLAIAQGTGTHFRNLGKADDEGGKNGELDTGYLEERQFKHNNGKAQHNQKRQYRIYGTKQNNSILKELFKTPRQLMIR